MRIPDLTAVIEDRQNQGRIQFKEGITGAGCVKLAVHVTEDSLGPGRNSIDLVGPREGIIDCNPKVFIRRNFLQLRAVQKQGLVVPLLPLLLMIMYLVLRTLALLFLHAISISVTVVAGSFSSSQNLEVLAGVESFLLSHKRQHLRIFHEFG